MILQMVIQHPVPVWKRVALSVRRTLHHDAGRDSDDAGIHVTDNHMETCAQRHSGEEHVVDQSDQRQMFRGDDADPFGYDVRTVVLFRGVPLRGARDLLSGVGMGKIFVQERCIRTPGIIGAIVIRCVVDKNVIEPQLSPS